MADRDEAEVQRWLGKTNDQYRVEWPQLSTQESPAERKLAELQQPTGQ